MKNYRKVLMFLTFVLILPLCVALSGCFNKDDEDNGDKNQNNGSRQEQEMNEEGDGGNYQLSTEQYAIIINQSAYGEIFCTVSGRRIYESAHAGSRVSLSYNIYYPNRYMFVSWIVVDADENPIEVTGNSFIMPEKNVTVGMVVEERTYSLTIDESILDKCTITIEDENGNNITSARYNQRVYLICTANDGYVFKKWSVYTTGYSPVTTSTNSSEYFYMGNDSVIVSAEIDPVSYYVEIGTNPYASTFVLNDSQNHSIYSATTGSEIYVDIQPVDGYSVVSLKYTIYNYYRNNYGAGYIKRPIEGYEGIDIDLNTKKFVVPAINGANRIEVFARIEMVERTLSITYLDQDQETVITDIEPSSFKTTDDSFELPNIKKTGYRFLGWYLNSGDEYDPEMRIEEIYPNANSEDIVLYAKWVKVGTIIYHLGVMEDVEGYEITNGNPTTYENTDNIVFENASQRGATFNGWYTTENFAEGTEITGISASETDAEDLEIYAKWTYTAFAVSGNYGYYYWNYLYVYQELELGEAYKAGYDFVAWYTTRDWQVGTEITKIEKGQIVQLLKNQTYIVNIYPKFELKENTITYHLNNGTIAGNANPATYTVEDEDITLASPTRSGYEFNGWFTEDTYDNKVEKIKHGTYGDLNLYALWVSASSDFLYNKNTINGLTTGGKSKTALAIPSEIDGTTITAIAPYSFQRETTMESIVIPDTVTTIGEFCFDQCENLATVEFAGNSTLTEITSAVFRRCINLTSINLPDTIQTIGQYAFYYAKNNFVSLPSSLRTIGQFAFSGNKTTNFVLPKSVTSVANNAFESMTAETFTFEEGTTIQSIAKRTFSIMHNLTSITIPASVRSIGEEAFYYCDHLQTFSFASGSMLTSIGKKAFEGTAAMSTITLPSSLTVIGEESFFGSGIVSIQIPRTVTKICKKAFANEWNATHYLTTLTFENGDSYLQDGCNLTEIEEEAFLYCKNLTEVHLPSKLETIGRAAFSYCTSLSCVILRNSVRYIGSGCFYNIDYENFHDSQMASGYPLQWYYGTYNYETGETEWTLCNIGYQYNVNNDNLKSFLRDIVNNYEVKRMEQQ